MRVVKFGQSLQKIWGRVIGNFYVSTTSVFLIWMLFFDSNDFLSQFRYMRQLHAAKKEKEYYEEKTLEVSREREELQNNPELLEKFAREKYLMKRADEDVFLVEEKD